MKIYSKKSKILCAVFIEAIIPISLLGVASANGASNIINPPKPICRIEVDNAHISRHMIRFQDRRGVLVSARSKCSVLHSRVMLTVQLYKVEKFGNHLLKTVSTNPNKPESSGYLVRNNAAFIDCRNYKRTRYFGIATSKALINGKWKYAGRARSDKTIEINCGT